MDDRHARARRSDADRRRRPVDGFRAASLDRFHRLVDDALASLPEPLVRELERTRIVVRDVPSSRDLGRGEVVLVDYVGPHPHPGGDAPARLTLYRRPIEARAHDRTELAALLRHVVLHEVAHHLGIDDDRIEELGWE